MEKTPLVVVEGFLGGGLGANLWKGVETLINPSHLDLDEHSEGYRRILTVSVGPVSSLHDRACELYYALRGGTVDYGSSHSSEHNHARYGRTHPTGIYPRWSKERPLHFLGHSIGGPTIIKLQHLMKEGHFGKDADPDMVLSVTSICSPFRGTQLVYTLGESTHSAPSVRPFSVGALIAKVVHLLAYIAPPTPVANDEASVDGRRSSWLEYFQVLDLHPESRSLSYRDISFLQFLRYLWRSDWAESKDATPYDMTFEAADLRESSGEGLPFPNTFYQSHVFSMTKLMSPSSGSGQNYHTPSGISWIASGPLYLMSRSIGKFDFSLIRPLPSFCVPPKSGLDPLEEFAKLSPLPAVDNRESSSILEDSPPFYLPPI
ncbi:lipase [Coprinopsis cinerea okayama7|uniref:Lipase n=1 Tax=Coprinopsis cinerea (strain Okayama-7 / 130 / ATCC MYA-4618 / FGSC 9003) TaxID=240176 RepID=A8N2F2_COPC7|nr:lipase [Coprinopsis cinerea okayama7\|eukprot:XP_001829125.1 lipase [Coprinopsis cinerea okayama7\